MTPIFIISPRGTATLSQNTSPLGEWRKRRETLYHITYCSSALVFKHWPFISPIILTNFQPSHLIAMPSQCSDVEKRRRNGSKSAMKFLVGTELVIDANSWYVVSLRRFTVRLVRYSLLQPRFFLSALVLCAFPFPLSFPAHFFEEPLLREFWNLLFCRKDSSVCLTRISLLTPAPAPSLITSTGSNAFHWDPNISVHNRTRHWKVLHVLPS